MAPRKKADTHGLDAGEGIVGERRTDDGQRIAVTSEGRKVVLADDGSVIERLVGPAYGWESSEGEAEEGE